MKDEEYTQSPKQATTEPKASHKRNLSNGTQDNSPARRSKRQRSTINLKEASSSEKSDIEVDQEFEPKKKTPVKSTPKSARSKKSQPASVKKESIDDTDAFTIRTDEAETAVKIEEDLIVKTETKVAATQKKATPAKRARKTKEEKEAEAMPLAARTKGLKMFVGAHVSAAKGVFNSIHNSERIG
jgi:AP endonuclease-1